MNETSREMGIINDELHDLIIQTNQRQEILAYLHWVNVKDVHLSHMIVSELEFCIKALTQLHHRYLPSYFVSVSELSGILSSIQDILSDEYPQYELLYRDAESYYVMNDIVSIHSRENIVIRLRVPLRTIAAQYVVYKVKSYPLKLHSGSSSRSVVEVVPLLGISVDGEYFLELEQTALDTCYGNYHKICPLAFTPKPTTTTHCALAILTDDLINIKYLCNFKLLLPTNANYAYLEYVGNSSVFISTNDLDWHLKCNDNYTDIVSCDLCVVKQDCLCSIEAKSFVIPPSIDSCGINESLATSVKHHIDLGAILHVLSDQALKNLSIKGETFSFTKFNKTPIELVNLESHLNFIAELDTIDKHEHTDLKKLIKLMQSHNITEDIMGHLHLSHISWFAKADHEYWMTILFTVFGTMTTIALVYLLFRCCRCGRNEVKFLATMFSGLIPTVKAWDDIERALEPSTTPSENVKSTEHPIYTVLLGYPLYNITHLLQVLTLIVFFAILIYCWKKCIRFCFTCRQVAELDAGCVLHLHVFQSVDKSYSFPLVRIPATFKQIMVSDYGENLDVKMVWVCGCFPFLTWNNEVVRVELKRSHGVHKLPGKVRIPIRLAYAISRVLKGPFTVQLVLSDKKGIYPVVRRSAFIMTEPNPVPTTFGTLDDIDIEPSKF